MNARDQERPTTPLALAAGPALLVRLLPATYLEMSPDKEEQAVAAVAGLLGTLGGHRLEMALTRPGTWRSSLQTPGSTPGGGGGDDIEEDDDPARGEPRHQSGDAGGALPPDLH